MVWTQFVIRQCSTLTLAQLQFEIYVGQVTLKINCLVLLPDWVTKFLVNYERIMQFLRQASILTFFHNALHFTCPNRKLTCSRCGKIGNKIGRAHAFWSWDPKFEPCPLPLSFSKAFNPHCCSLPRCMNGFLVWWKLAWCTYKVARQKYAPWGDVMVYKIIVWVWTVPYDQW